MLKKPAFRAQLSNFEFTPDSLTLKLGGSLTVSIGPSTFVSSSLYSSKDRFFVLHVPETNAESPPLFLGDSYQFEFPCPGIYHIACFNYVRCGMIVKVVEDAANDSWALSEESVADESVKQGRSLFSEETLEPRREKPEGLDTISNCLESIAKGKDVAEIRKEFKPLFEDESEDVLDLGFDHIQILENSSKKRSDKTPDPIIEINEDDNFSTHSATQHPEVATEEPCKLFEFSSVSKKNPAELQAIFEQIEDAVYGKSFCGMDNLVSYADQHLPPVMIEGEPSSPSDQAKFLNMLKAKFDHLSPN